MPGEASAEVSFGLVITELAINGGYVISSDLVGEATRGTEQQEVKAEKAELGRGVRTAASLNPKP